MNNEEKKESATIALKKMKDRLRDEHGLDSAMQKAKDSVEGWFLELKWVAGLRKAYEAFDEIKDAKSLLSDSPTTEEIDKFNSVQIRCGAVIIGAIGSVECDLCRDFCGYEDIINVDGMNLCGTCHPTDYMTEKERWGETVKSFKRRRASSLLREWTGRSDEDCILMMRNVDAEG